MELAIQSLLRSTEQVRLTLDTTLVRRKDDTGDDQTLEDSTTTTAAAGQDEARLLIAIISHKDTWSGEDEGGVFVFKENAISDNDGLELERVYPIDNTFILSIAQSHREPGDVARLSIHEAAPTGFTFSLSGGQMQEFMSSMEPTYFTRDVTSLRNFSKACSEIRRTYEVGQAAQVSLQVTTRFQWLEPYIAQSGQFTAFDIRPQDLRTLNQPLHTRLSPASAGLPGDDLADLRLVRDEWIRTTSRLQSSVGNETLKIRIGTFNVNGQMPSQDLSTWVQGKLPSSYPGGIPPADKLPPLPLDKTSCGDTLTSLGVERSSGAQDVAWSKEAKDKDPDVIVLGFQELDLSTEALIYSTTTFREDTWYAAAIAALGEKGGEFKKLASRQLVGMLIIVLVKTSLAPFFSDVRTAAAGVGVLGVMGNKGGVAIRLSFSPQSTSETSSPGPTIITFVNAHLAAFDEQYERRNFDYRDLAKRLVMAGQPASGEVDSKPASIFETDYLFWMVYLNYRLEVPDADIRSILSADNLPGRLEVLLKYDQLRLAKRQKKAFEGFQEPPITFLPTYRSSQGVLRDALDYDVKRKPAWTDRVMYMTSSSGLIQSTSYIGHPHIKLSDHKPVSADYCIRADIYDIEFRKETAKKLFQSTHALDDPSSKRELKIDTTIVEFGDVHYLREQSRKITVQNTGKIPCVYRFVAAEEDHEILPDWLRLEPMHAFLLPDEIIQITLTVLVHNACASRMNLTERDLRATLILHTLLGKDYFISVTGTYQFTCFANKLSTLTRLPEPIRKVSSVDDLLPESQHINAPKEVMRLVNWLMAEHADVEGLFVIPGDEEKVRDIRECLDTGEEFPSSMSKDDRTVHLAFATTLLLFLDSLSKPVVPSSLHVRCTHMTSRDEAFDLLDEFPPSSVNVWISVTAYLHFICQTAPTPEKKAEKEKQIAMIFAPVLLRDDNDVTLPLIPPLAKIAFLLYFIS